MTAATHKCGSPKCAAQIPLHLFMCRADWARVPTAHQRAVYSTFRAYEKTPTEATAQALRSAQRAAVAAVAW